MKMLKKIGLFALVLMLVLAAAACSKKETTKKPSDNEQNTPTAGDNTDKDNKPSEGDPDNKPGDKPDDKPNDNPDDKPTEPAKTEIDENWRDKVKDSGYKGVKLHYKYSDDTQYTAEYDEDFADRLAYIVSLIDKDQSKGPKAYRDSYSFNAAFDDPTNNNYGAEIIYLKHTDGKEYVAVKVDKENILWLSESAVYYFRDLCGLDKTDEQNVFIKLKIINK